MVWSGLLNMLNNSKRFGLVHMISLESGQQASSTDNTDPLNDPNYADPFIDESLKKKQESWADFCQNRAKAVCGQLRKVFEH
ncbi:hypothetical protein QTP88_004151 [Uroleucon formosanum]